MAVTIKGVEPGSLAAKLHIRPGETLVSINGEEIVDVLDYRFYMTDRHLRLQLRAPDGSERMLRLAKEEYEDLGLEFETYLMDKQHTCRNHCVFCFVDQMPPGMRQSLYFKDDDARLSFLFGNYITLTNLSEQEVDRIIKMRISPVNVSVHTTDPQLRVQLMKNPAAATSLSYLRRLTQGGIQVNTQLVLCPGINDGEQLRRSIRDLYALGEHLQSIACVPVGLTKYRQGLYPLRTFTQQEAAAVIDIIEACNAEAGERRAYPSDEFFLKAGRPFPPYEYYGEFAQLENGVGLCTLLEHEFTQALDDLEGPPPGWRARTVSIATGVAAGGVIGALAARANAAVEGLDVRVYVIENEFFGKDITVTGLLTGTDLIRQLRGRELGEELIISANMLRHEQDRMLDDTTIPQLAEALGVPVRIVENDGFELLDAFLGIQA